MVDFTTIEQQMNDAIEALDQKDPKKRREGIYTFARIMNSAQYSVSDAVKINKMVQQHIPTLIDFMKTDEDTSNRKVAVKTLGKMTTFSEIVPALEEIILGKIDDLLLTLEAGTALLNFPEGYQLLRKLILEMLSAPEEIKQTTALRLIIKSREEKQKQKKTGESLADVEHKIQKDWLKILRNIVREAKTAEIGRMAWYALTRIAPEKEEEERIALQQELLYRLVYEVINKFQPEIQVQLSRIMELTTPLIEKQKIFPTQVELEKQNYPKEMYVEVLKEIVEDEIIKGKYFEMEQVFVKTDKEAKYSLTATTISKNYICRTCGMPIERDEKKCPNCKSEIPRCNVCKLPISFGEEAGKCSLCEAKGHLNHLQEWVKIKGKCPTCQKKLPIEGIVPLAMELKKK